MRGRLFYSKIVCLAYLASTITGCALKTSLYHQGNLIEQEKIVLSVPYIQQKPNYCGPAALSMIFGYYGISIDQDEIAKEIYHSDLEGTLSIDMVLYALKQGFEAEMYQCTFQKLKAKIAAGFPLVVSQRFKKSNKKVHYLVVWGFDDVKQELYIHSVTENNHVIDYKTFIKRWHWAENLSLWIYRK